MAMSHGLDGLSSYTGSKALEREMSTSTPPTRQLEYSTFTLYPIPRSMESRGTYLLCIAGGLSLPTERWTEIMTEVNSKIEALEMDYENICIENKVNEKTLKNQQV